MYFLYGKVIEHLIIRRKYIYIYQFKSVHLYDIRFFRVEFLQLLNVLYSACIFHFNLSQEVHAT